MVRRDFWVNRLHEAWARRSVIWLHGVRRSGKTTLCQSLDGVAYFDCELPSVRRQLDDPELFFRRNDGLVALDEVHRLPNPSEVLKVAADHFPGVKVIATGSSTLAATDRFRDTLAGRKESVWLTPAMSRDLIDFDISLETRLWRGGIPPFLLAEPAFAASAHEEWLEAFWARDIQSLFRLERRAAFLRFVELLLVHSGGVFEAQSYAERCEVSRTTIANYLSALEITRMVHVVRPHTTRRATEIVKAPRVFAFDTGFVRHARGWVEPRTEDFGQMWEHYVLNEVHARLPSVQPRHWRTKSGHEVDFVFNLPGGRLVAVECKWSPAGLGSLAGLGAFVRAYPAADAFVVLPYVERTYDVRVGSGVATVLDLEGMIQALVPQHDAGR